MVRESFKVLGADQGECASLDDREYIMQHGEEVI